MTIRFQKIADADREALIDFMFLHAPIMMFPLTNLTRYGLGGDNPRAIDAWVALDEGTITDVVTVSNEGIVFPCCPNGNWLAAAKVIGSRGVKGFIGDGAQVSALRDAMKITSQARLDVLEPAYLLALADLKMPVRTGMSLRSLSEAPFELMVQWRAAYDVETLFVPEAEAKMRAEQQIRNFIAIDSHRVLFQGDTPVAMTGFNATLPEIVQIGGVYTPPEYRSRGFARLALALHLEEVLVDGVIHAVLSAASAAAANAYMAIGFERVGDFALVVYDDLQVANG